MKLITLLSLLPATMAGQISFTCRNFALDPATDVLSGECNDGQGDHAAFQKTSLDLDTCLAYDTTLARIVWRKGGNFSTQCKGCTLVWTTDPVWGNQLLNLDCTCSGANARFEIDHSYIDNKFGALVCSSYL